MAGAFKHKFSPMVVAHLRRRYATSGGARELAEMLKEETGYEISHQSLLDVVDDDKHIQSPDLYD